MGNGVALVSSVRADDAAVADQGSTVAKTGKVNNNGRSFSVVRKGANDGGCCIGTAFIAAAIGIIGLSLLLRYAVGVKTLVPTAGADGSVFYRIMTSHPRGLMIAGSVLLGIGGTGAIAATAAAVKFQR